MTVKQAEGGNKLMAIYYLEAFQQWWLLRRHYEDTSIWSRAAAAGPLCQKNSLFPSSDVICLRRENNASRHSYLSLIREEGQAWCLGEESWDGAPE